MLATASMTKAHIAEEIMIYRIMIDRKPLNGQKRETGSAVRIDSNVVIAPVSFKRPAILTDAVHY